MFNPYYWYDQQVQFVPNLPSHGSNHDNWYQSRSDPRERLEVVDNSTFLDGICDQLMVVSKQMEEMNQTIRKMQQKLVESSSTILQAQKVFTQHGNHSVTESTCLSIIEETKDKEHQVFDKMRLKEFKRITPLMKMKFPKFDGLHPVEWIDKCNTYFEILKTIPEDKKVFLATTYMEGDAKLWCNEFVLNFEALSWSHFINMVLEKFVEVDSNFSTAHKVESPIFQSLSLIESEGSLQAAKSMEISGEDLSIYVEGKEFNEMSVQQVKSSTNSSKAMLSKKGTGNFHAIFSGGISVQMHIAEQRGRANSKHGGKLLKFDARSDDALSINVRSHIAPSFDPGGFEVNRSKSLSFCLPNIDIDSRKIDKSTFVFVKSIPVQKFVYGIFEEMSGIVIIRNLSEGIDHKLTRGLIRASDAYEKKLVACSYVRIDLMIFPKIGGNIILRAVVEQFAQKEEDPVFGERLKNEISANVEKDVTYAHALKLRAAHFGKELKEKSYSTMIEECTKVVFLLCICAFSGPQNLCVFFVIIHGRKRKFFERSLLKSDDQRKMEVRYMRVLNIINVSFMVAECKLTVYCLFGKQSLNWQQNGGELLDTESYVEFHWVEVWNKHSCSLMFAHFSSLKDDLTCGINLKAILVTVAHEVDMIDYHENASNMLVESGKEKQITCCGRIDVWFYEPTNNFR